MNTIVSMKVYQPKTEIAIDSDGIVIEQSTEMGETAYVTFDRIFLPILIEWIKSANDSLNCTDDNCSDA